MYKVKRKYSRFQLIEPDCKARIGDIGIKVYSLNTKPRIEYTKKQVPQEIKTAVKIWTKYQKYGGLSLTDYLNALFKND